MMPDNRSSLPIRKSALIAPLIIAAVVALLFLGVFVMRGAPDESESPPQAPIAPVAPPPPQLTPPSTAPLTRSDLIARASEATAAYAAGVPLPAPKDPMVGRRFSLRIPFGCLGPQAGAGLSQAYYEYDPVKKTIRLVARPGIWTTFPLMQDLNKAEEIEAVEGFWVPRPWSHSEGCAPNRNGPIPVTPTPAAAQTLGLARIFDKDGSRVLRRDGRAYEFVRKVDEGDQSPMAHSYRLVLEGRMEGYGDGRAVRCWSESADHRPVCFYAIAFERVAFEDADSGAMLAEWRE
jgi:hypothetical protein